MTINPAPRAAAPISAPIIVHGAAPVLAPINTRAAAPVSAPIILHGADERRGCGTGVMQLCNFIRAGEVDPRGNRARDVDRRGNRAGEIDRRGNRAGRGQR